MPCLAPAMPTTWRWQTTSRAPLSKEPTWSEKLEGRLRWLPFDWCLIAPFFLLGSAPGVCVLLWFLIVLTGQGG